ncbi:FtsB family cell division protein [Parapontixanthobacter aurantiacus]|nr:septum formation initiator family protein [Parapontixanthobacter aurantiacus]
MAIFLAKITTLWWFGAVMQRRRFDRMFRKENRTRTVGMGAMGLIVGLALVGPSGLLSWSETLRLRDARAAQLAELEERRDELQHRVTLLSPDSADPDLVSELIRENLNVVHPDEMVIILDDPVEPAAR